MNKQQKTLLSIKFNLSKEQDRLNDVIDHFDEVRDNLSYADLLSEHGAKLTEFLDVLTIAENQLADVIEYIKKAMKL